MTAHLHGTHELTQPSRGELLLRAGRHPLAALVRTSLSASGVADQDPLLLLVSGGGDSMSLLLLVAALRERTDPSLNSLAVLTLDYGLREEARHETARVTAFARHLGIQRVETTRVELPVTGNTLDAARDARHDAAFDSCTRYGIAHVLLGHQADDRAEGVLLALSRGMGLESLARVLPTRAFTSSDGAQEAQVLRPLLRARREELRDFLRELNVPWCEDPSNAKRARGALRTNAAQAQLVDSIAASAAELCDDAAALLALRTALVESLLPRGHCAMTRAEFDRAHEALRKPLLLRMVQACDAEISRASLHAALDSLERGERTPKSFACSNGVTLTLDARHIEARKRC